MSRLALVVLLLSATPAMAGVPGESAIARYRSMTVVEPRCAVPRPGSEIVVCGRRQADRWRVPYLLKEPGDPSIQNVSAERNALIATTTPCQDHSIFLVGCGKGVGIGASVGFGAGSPPLRIRPIAD